jgi:hypothetical protein
MTAENGCLFFFERTGMTHLPLCLHAGGILTINKATAAGCFNQLVQPLRSLPLGAGNFLYNLFALAIRIQ